MEDPTRFILFLYSITVACWWNLPWL